MINELIPEGAVHYGGLWQRQVDVNAPGADMPRDVRAILFGQLVQHGFPPIDLPKLHAPSPLAVKSAIFGVSEVPMMLIALRHEKHAELIARDGVVH